LRSSRTAFPEPTLSEASEIDELCEMAATVGRRQPDRVFAEVPKSAMPDTDQKSVEFEWRAYDSKESLAAETEDPPTMTAVVRRLPQGITFASLFYNGSEHWHQYADHCFRPDGTLARLADAFVTHYLDQNVLRARTT